MLWQTAYPHTSPHTHTTHTHYALWSALATVLAERPCLTSYSLSPTRGRSRTSRTNGLCFLVEPSRCPTLHHSPSLARVSSVLFPLTSPTCSRRIPSTRPSVSPLTTYPICILYQPTHRAYGQRSLQKLNTAISSSQTPPDHTPSTPPSGNTPRATNHTMSSSKAPSRSSRHRRYRSIPPDPIDVLDNTSPAGVYHHGGPYDATLLSRNLNPKYSPLAAVRDSNMAALEATPREFVDDALTKHVPLQGTSSVPPGQRDLGGAVMRYEDGADMMREEGSHGGAYKRWPGLVSSTPRDTRSTTSMRSWKLTNVLVVPPGRPQGKGRALVLPRRGRKGPPPPQARHRLHRHRRLVVRAPPAPRLAQVVRARR